MSARQAVRALRERFHPSPPEPGHGRFSALRALDRLADFHRERAVEPVRETAFRLDRCDPAADSVRWPFDYVDAAPGAPTCDLGTDCLCTPSQVARCEFSARPHGEPRACRTVEPRGLMVSLSNHLAGYDTLSRFLIGSIILLGVCAFAAGYSWGAI